MVMEIKFHGEDIRLLPSGALMIMSEHVLVLADLHLGKGVQLRDHGVPLIDQLDTKTILKLQEEIDNFAENLETALKATEKANRQEFFETFGISTMD